MPGALRAVCTALAALALVPAAPADAAADPAGGRCEAGRLCLWQQPDFKGARHTYELTDTGIQSCVPLPHGTTAEALANRMGRPVTAYQSGECAETGEFETYPGDGTWVPQTPYQVRAFKVWEH
ncbi:peptidase inhibitor family I36 protein [Streptomyces odontomachi]|uniref:peptidase inhibitor family I36 protein n=1 Tax=Streptomyces odontomachi TaxID=2944940 RepID=UPI0027E39418|nr:peptidase inhibitor family I36 protein [Streptomyces sp. ODS25]